MGVHLHPNASAPPAAIMRVLTRFDRSALEGFISVAIDLLDTMDGNPDEEADDRGGETVAIVDDPDFPPEEEGEDPDLEQTRDEDDWFVHPAEGPGCPISDLDAIAWAETSSFQPDQMETGAWNEDDEDDDPGGGNIIDEPHDQEYELTPDYGIDQTHALTDGFVIASDRNAMRLHRDRVRQENCDRLARPDHLGRAFRLRELPDSRLLEKGMPDRDRR